MVGNLAILGIFTLVVLGAPLVGVRLSGRPVALFATFPPLTAPAAHPPFAWPVFIAYLLPVGGVVGLIIVAAGYRHPAPAAAPAPGRYPVLWWGWFALVVLIVSWVLAWTRFSWAGPIQRLLFIPLWLAYIGVANALCVRCTGTCPLRREPGFFAALFPLSAGFWWGFEYLNQFVRNWYYTGVEYGPLAYSVHATIAFSTVLPAVYTTRWWLAEGDWFRDRFAGLPSLRRYASPLLNWPLLLLGGAGMVGVGLRPDELFPLLWLAPPLLFVSLRHLAGRPTLFTAVADGDWRPLLTAATAALVCGFFWEMWNHYSLAKWQYSIPYVHRFELFAMPVLGYMGYLPFGLLCVEFTNLFREMWSGGRKGAGPR